MPTHSEAVSLEPTRGGIRAPTRGADPLVGRTINDRFRVQSVIAQGGMGKVYRAEQSPLGRAVAIKILSANYHGDGDPEFHKRFFLEASIASKLSHPNTVTIFDYGKTDDAIFYIAMELLEGRTLQRELKEQGTLSPERTVHIVTQICRSLREAHGLGVIHRDLKPANVFLVQHGDENDFVKVLDFGLVKDLAEKAEQLTETGLFLGSPKYMAPEQVRGEHVDVRTDIYALGVIMLELLTGRVPFESANSLNILMAHVHEPVPSIRALNRDVKVSPRLEQLVLRCVAKRPQDRFASMDELLEALKRCSSDALHTPADLQMPEGVQNLLASHQAGTANANVQARAGGASPSYVPFAHASRSASSSAPLVLAALFALTGIAGVLFMGGQLQLRGGEPIRAESLPAGGTAAEHGGEALAERAPSLLVSLRSTPPGAMVVIDGTEYGPTPTEVELTGSDAKVGRQLSFRFRRTGFRAVTISREVRGARLEVEATFQDPSARAENVGRR